MTAQTLDRVITAYRIGDPNGRFPIFDATGSTLSPGRWNSHRSPVIYASEHYATAMLEKLARGQGMIPPHQHFIEITIPNGVSYEVANIANLPGWDEQGSALARGFGEAWCLERRSLVLFVLSVVARMERNLLINPAHPEFPHILSSLHQPIWWDVRLFG